MPTKTQTKTRNIGTSERNGSVHESNGTGPTVDWRRVAKTLLISRAVDTLEETRLFPEKLTSFQISSRGHELGQILLGTMLTGRRDGASVNYRSRPLLLTLGLKVADVLKGNMGKACEIWQGRDSGQMQNRLNENGCSVLPTSGGVGTQYTPAAGWAHAIRYHAETLGDVSYQGSIAVVVGGDGSVASNGFWSALNIATTRKLPLLFFLEDNGFGLTVPSTVQTPGGNIAKNLASYNDLRFFHADTSKPAETAQVIADAVQYVRAGKGAGFLRLVMPRLNGHSGQDTQAYKSPELLEAERLRDPLIHLRSHMVPSLMSEVEWKTMEQEAEEQVQQGLAEALAAPLPDSSPAAVVRYRYAEDEPAIAASVPAPEPTRTNMLTAIRRTLQSELQLNPRLLVFGEDVGVKGGVHAATMGLQTEFGAARVFDTSLSEEGIIGNAVGMALAGLRPVAEIQFRKYADPCMEQLNDCGSMRWRTGNRCSAPIVVRMPGGFGPRCGDPWHGASNEVAFVHAPGWQLIYPSNAEDAAGLLRTAMRSKNPSIFFEHRYLLDATSARRPYPGDDFALPLGVAKTVQSGTDLTVVTWGAMVDRCLQAALEAGVSADIIDLRTLAPWDRDTVIESIRRTHRCIVVHEDALSAGFGAEIAAIVGREAFLYLDAPVERMAVPDIPLPYSVPLMEAILPNPHSIAQQMRATLAF
jgi:2-oxoisovalerate dehydrogenase E1 component